MKTSAAFVLGLFSFFLVLESNADNTTTLTSTTEQMKMPASPRPSQSQIILGLKSTNSTGRFGYLNDKSTDRSKGLNFNGKQEIFAGYKFQNNWGAFAQVTQSRKQYNDSINNKWVASDPSISLIHPNLYQSDTLTIKGLFRAYIPLSDRSRQQNIRQYAYYSTQTLKMSDGAEISNVLIPRLFVADRYLDTDTRLYLEDRTTYVRSINSWSRWGLGQWTQVEQHANTPTGYSLDLIPQIDFVYNPTTFIGPRLSLPLFTQNSVFDGPNGASLDEARAELYFQMSL